MDRQARARLLFGLATPPLVYREDGAVRADECGLLRKAVDNRLNFLPGAGKHLKAVSSYIAPETRTARNIVTPVAAYTSSLATLRPILC